MRICVITVAVGTLCLCAVSPGRPAPPGVMMDLVQANPPAPVIAIPADCGGVSGDLSSGLVRILGADGKSLAGAIVWSAKPTGRAKPDPAVPERLRVVPGTQAAGLVLGDKLDIKTLPSYLRLYAPTFLPYSGPNVYLWRDDGAQVQVYHHKHIIHAVAVIGKVIIQDGAATPTTSFERWPTWAQASMYVPVTAEEDHTHGHRTAGVALSSWMNSRAAIGVMAVVGLLAGWGIGRNSGRIRR